MVVPVRRSHLVARGCRAGLVVVVESASRLDAEHLRCDRGYRLSLRWRRARPGVRERKVRVHPYSVRDARRSRRCISWRRWPALASRSPSSRSPPWWSLSRFAVVFVPVVLPLHSSAARDFVSSSSVAGPACSFGGAEVACLVFHRLFSCPFLSRARLAVRFHRLF